MPTPLKEWRSTAMEHYKKLPAERLAHYDFLRDPCRAHRINGRKFFSPADGIIIGQSRVMPDDDLIETKGTHCSLAELMEPWEVDGPCLVISIFLTAYDVHIVRSPTSGIMTHQRCGKRLTMNLPMLFEEQEICDKGRVSKQDLKYMAYNARELCRFWNSAAMYRYYLVLLADSDVSGILPFDHRKHAPLSQSERAFVVRWGSQATLVLPLDKRFRFRTIQRITDHVEAGVDPLVKIERTRRPA